MWLPRGTAKLMFRVSGLQIDPTAQLPAGAPSITSTTTGAVHQLQVHSWFTVPIDIEVDCSCSMGLLTSASGAAWTKPALIPPNLTPPSPGLMIHEPILKAATTATGSEVINCGKVRYRYPSAPNFNPDHSPLNGHTVIVSVT
jgi:hypothetical protein